jgi:hypothetical protein
MTHRYVTAAVARELAGQLSERDVAILRRVSDLRFVSGGQLTRMHFTDATDRAARRALLRLTRLDCLERLPRRVGGVRAGSAGFVYRLGLAGQRVASERGWQSKRRGRQSRIPGTLFLSHALQVAELHTLLIEADCSRRLELLELSAEPACWRSYGGIGAQRATLKPDSYLRLGAGEYEDSYFIEVDRGTEGSRALEGQLKRYLAYQASGREQAEHGVFPKVLWTAPDEQRAAVVRSCIEQLAPAFRELFGVSPFGDVVNALAVPKLLPES